jgi:hypothetical protein
MTKETGNRIEQEERKVLPRPAVSIRNTADSWVLLVHKSRMIHPAITFHYETSRRNGPLTGLNPFSKTSCRKDAVDTSSFAAKE